MKNFFVITGPSAVGKSTIINYILLNPSFHLSVSYTTRNPRPGECDGVHYNFLSREVFLKKIEEGFFLEHTFFNNNYYGTPAHLDITNQIIIFDIDIRGYRFFKSHYPESYFCLITADRASIKKRLETRMIVHNNTINIEEVGSRMQSFDDFMEMKDLAFNRTIDNSGELRNGLEQTNGMIEEILDYFKNK